MEGFEIWRASHRSVRKEKRILEEEFGGWVTNLKGSDYMPITPRYTLTTLHKSCKNRKVHSSLVSISSLQGYLSAGLGFSTVLSTAHGLCYYLILILTLRMRYYSPQCKEEEIKAYSYTKIDEAAKLNPSHQSQDPELNKHHILTLQKPEISGQKKKRKENCEPSCLGFCL